MECVSLASLSQRFKNNTLYWYLKRKRRKKNCRNDGHSQYGQDLVAFELLGKPATGVFIDIGANDGITISNSLLFEEKGWQGICIEPHPSIFNKLQQNRHCHCVNACIADKDGWVDFLAVEGPANMLSGIYSFMDPHHKERIEKEISENGGDQELIKIEAITPATLLKRFSITEIDFLSVDTEGCELPILQTFNFEKNPAKVISVENGSRSASLFEFLSSREYSLHKCIGCDEIYTRK